MTQGTPRRDGSGRGVRANRGRGGCETTRSEGQGQSGNSFFGRRRRPRRRRFF